MDGSYSSGAGRIDAYSPTETTEEFEPLDASSGPPELRVFDFLDRAAWDVDRSLEDQVVRLEGLVVNDPDVPDGFMLTRFMVSCCAADGIPLQVMLHNTGAAVANETWVIADVIWRPPSTPYREQPSGYVVEADAVSLTVVPDAPNDPYESPY